MTAPFVSSVAPLVLDPPFGVPENPLATVWRFRGDQLQFLLDATAEHEIVQVRLGVIRLYIVREPEHVKHILVDNNQNYDKQTRAYNALREVLGQGLLTSEGDFWRRQRRIAQPAFHRQRIASFAETMTSVTLSMLESWEPAIRSHEPLDMAREMMRLTLRIAGLTLLGADVQDTATDVGEAVSVISHRINDQITQIIPVPSWVPTPSNRRVRHNLEALDRIVHGIIRERRRKDEHPHDLLAMLMDVQDEETGERMTDSQLRDEVITMFLAGHETTATALSWTFYLLSLHPQVMRAVQREVDEVLGERPPTAADVPQLRYTERVVKESMRLYPPAWVIDRRVVEDDMVGGHRFAAGSMVFLSPWVSHRNPKQWPNPLGFDPDRFTPDQERERPRYAYFPFGGGPHLCIGQPFAMMEAVLILAAVLQRVSVSLVPGRPVVPQPLVTLRPKNGVWMRLARRDR